MESERENLDKQVHRLVDAIAKMGLSQEIQKGIAQRQTRVREVEMELAQVEQGLALGRVEISDEALHSLAQSKSELLLTGGNDEVRAVLRQCLARVDLGKEKLTLRYVTPIVQGQPKTRLNSVPPWG